MQAKEVYCPCKLSVSGLFKKQISKPKNREIMVPASPAHPGTCQSDTCPPSHLTSGADSVTQITKNNKMLIMLKLNMYVCITISFMDLALLSRLGIPF